MANALGDKRVAEVMTEDVATLKATANVADAIATLANNRVSGMPVEDEDGVIVGVLSMTDVATHLSAQHAPDDEEPSSFYDSVRLLRLLDQLLHKSAEAQNQVADIMSTILVSVAPDAKVADAARLMAQRRVHRLLVLDAGGRLAGIVSALDLVALLAP